MPPDVKEAGPAAASDETGNSDHQATGITSNDSGSPAKRRQPHSPHVPFRVKKRTQKRGYIAESDLRDSDFARAVRADLMDRLSQHYRERTLPRGPRGLFYDLRPNGIAGNSRGVIYRKATKDYTPLAKNGEASVAFVSDQLKEMRRVLLPDGTPLVPESWIADGRVPDPVAPYEFADADEFADEVDGLISTAMLCRQAGQPVHLEVWCEAADLMPRVARICGQRGITVFSGAGTDGLKGQKAVADRAARRAVPTVVGHIGDRDKAGECMFDALAENGFLFLDAMRSAGQATAASDLEFRRLALTVEQAAAHGLLDAEGKGEVDGLPVRVLDRILDDFLGEQDADIFDAVIDAEAEFRHELRERHL